MDLNDDDLNNHECMALVCQLVKDLDRITLLETSKNFPTSQPDLGHYTAKWVDRLTDVLSDKSRDKNVRLFLAQVSSKFLKNLHCMKLPVN